MQSDPLQAFIPYPLRTFSEQTGPLRGRTFAVKDLFDVEGFPTSFGQPHILARSGIKRSHAAMVRDLFDQGARFVGKTHLVEMAYALTGRNAHFGTPINPSAPDRLPGGSSSGSAAAVAGGLADIGLATDTLGSIRVPASYCGLYGLRPTYGRLSLEGACPLAPSLDTGGWLTRDGEILTQLAELFLQGPTQQKRRFLIPQTLIQDLEPDVAIAFEAFLKMNQEVLGDIGSDLDLDASLPDQCVETVRIIQGYEAWQAHGAMIENDQPALGPGILERFAYAAQLTGKAYQDAQQQRLNLAKTLNHAFGDAILMLPTAPGPAPLRSASDADLEIHRTALLRKLSLASLTGCPEVSFPGIKVKGLPVGISLIGPPGSDLTLCRCALSLKPSA